MLSSYGAGVLPQTVHEGHKGVVSKPFVQKTITSAVAAFMNITRYIFSYKIGSFKVVVSFLS